MRPLLVAVLTSLAAVATPALARAADAETLGKVNAQIEDKEKAIRDEYGSGKLDALQMREMDAKLRAARDEVLQQNGISPKEYEKGNLKLSKDDREKAAQSGEEYRKKRDEEAKKKAEEAKAAAEKQPEVVVEHHDDAPAKDSAGKKGGGSRGRR